MSNNMITAERLKICRIKADQTLEQIGILAGVHKSTVMRWEKGETERIGLPTIQLLATHYNVSPAWLMGADVPMNEKTETPAGDDRDSEIVRMFSALTPDEQKSVLDYIAFVLSKRSDS